DVRWVVDPYAAHGSGAGDCGQPSATRPVARRTRARGRLARTVARDAPVRGPSHIAAILEMARADRGGDRRLPQSCGLLSGRRLTECNATEVPDESRVRGRTVSGSGGLEPRGGVDSLSTQDALIFGSSSFAWSRLWLRESREN